MPGAYFWAERPVSLWENHTLPTMGTAKFSSALSVDDFVKRSQFLCYSSKAFRRDAEDIIRFAEAEGLTGHAESIRARL